MNNTPPEASRPTEPTTPATDLTALDEAWQGGSQREPGPQPLLEAPEPSAPNVPIRTTYTFWSTFRNCRKALDWRYLQELVPIERDPALWLGSLVHRGLEVWHGQRDLAAALSLIDESLPDRNGNERQRRDWHLATAMLRGYAERYSTEEFEVVALEKTFEGPIVNPATGAASRTFVLAGKVDGIVRIGDRYYILENKTAAAIDAGYLERLWTDFQIALYGHYVTETLGLPIAGAIYNILGKARLQQGMGETEEEFAARRGELIAKSKTGRSSAKQKLAESDDEFQARLAVKYADPEMFHRETIFVSRDQTENLLSELWELTQAFLEARRRGVFYQNTSFCFHFRKACPYFPLCRSNGSPVVIENFYERRAPHEELTEGAASDDVAPTETPAF